MVGLKGKLPRVSLVTTRLLNSLKQLEAALLTMMIATILIMKIKLKILTKRTETMITTSCNDNVHDHGTVHVNGQHHEPEKIIIRMVIIPIMATVKFERTLARSSSLNLSRL